MEHAPNSRIENRNLESIVGQEDNLPLVEQVLDAEAARLQRLQALQRQKRLDFGRTVSQDELDDLFPKIKRDVDDFLGMTTIGMPRYRHYNLFKDGRVFPLWCGVTLLSVCGSLFRLMLNSSIGNVSLNLSVGIAAVGTWVQLYRIDNTSFYARSSETVILERGLPRTTLIPLAAHEYAHHIQHARGLDGNEYFILKEGHARGVERHVAEEYREREDNEAFLYHILDETVGEFKSAYLWMCRKVHHQPKRSLLKIKTSRDYHERIERLMKRKPTPHALGNVLFSIREARYGRLDYGDMLRRDFQFS